MYLVHEFIIFIFKTNLTHHPMTKPEKVFWHDYYDIFFTSSINLQHLLSSSQMRNRMQSLLFD